MNLGQIKWDGGNMEEGRLGEKRKRGKRWRKKKTRWASVGPTCSTHCLVLLCW